jgi:hypothetical protein
MAEQTLTRHDLEAKIVKRCWENEGFRKEFTADPAGTFTKYLEVPAASLPKILVHEEEPGSWHIVLPSKPADAGTLSDADLERVAGGATPTIATVTPATPTTAITSLVVSYVSISASAIVSAESGW